MLATRPASAISRRGKHHCHTGDALPAAPTTGGGCTDDRRRCAASRRRHA